MYQFLYNPHSSNIELIQKQTNTHTHTHMDAQWMERLHCLKVWFGILDLVCCCWFPMAPSSFKLRRWSKKKTLKNKWESCFVPKTYKHRNSGVILIQFFWNENSVSFLQHFISIDLHLTEYNEWVKKKRKSMEYYYR